MMKNIVSKISEVYETLKEYISKRPVSEVYNELVKIVLEDKNVEEEIKKTVKNFVQGAVEIILKLQKDFRERLVINDVLLRLTFYVTSRDVKTLTDLLAVFVVLLTLTSVHGRLLVKATKDAGLYAAAQDIARLVGHIDEIAKSIIAAFLEQEEVSQNFV